MPGNMAGQQQAVGGQAKFIGQKMGQMNPSSYTAHRMSGGMPNDASTRVNDILIESQKMIYAPPSREKSK